MLGHDLTTRATKCERSLDGDFLASNCSQMAEITGLPITASDQAFVLALARRLVAVERRCEELVLRVTELEERLTK